MQTFWFPQLLALLCRMRNCNLFAEELPLVSKVNVNLQESAYNLLKGPLGKLKDGFCFVSGNLDTKM